MTSISVWQRDCPGGWNLFEGHCYIVVEDWLAGEDAENDCNNTGGHLASIHSASESSFINSLYSGLPIWIGGTYVAPEVVLQYKYMHI